MTKDHVRCCKYWLQQLADAADPVNFVVGPSGESSRRTREFVVPDFIRGHLVETVKGNDTAIVTCFVTCLRILMAKYTGAYECWILTSPNNEVTPENTRNSLYLKVNLTDNKKVRDLLNSELRQLAAAWQQQEYDLSMLEQQVSLNHDIELSELSKVSFFWNLVQVENKTCSQAPLCIQLTGQKDRQWKLVVRFEAAWPDDFVDQLMEHYLLLLDGILRVEADATLHQLPMLTHHAQQQLLTYCARMDGLMPAPNKLLIDKFLENVAASSARSAIVWNEKSMSYQQLNLLSNKLAGLLSLQGVQKGDIVLLSMPACFELVIAQLGILKAGALILPVDPVTPTDRLQMIISESRAAYMMVTDHEQSFNGVRTIKADLETILTAAEITAPVNTGPADPAYIVYTSGSTGKPKGVILSHRALAAQLDWLARYFHLGPGDVIPQKSSINIIDSIFEILGPVTFGNSAVYLKPYEEIMYDTPAQQINWLQRIGATWVIFVPALLSNLAGLLHKIRTLKTLVVSGEEMREQYNGNFECYNAYGLSECAGINTIYRCRDNARSKIPIGVPIDNTYVLLLDDNRRLVPPFVAADLYVGGQCVGSGFLHDAELTSARFVPDPYNQGATMYKTGDKAWWTADGQLVYLGRHDRQVKIRGVRVDLNEIEQVLECRPEIQQAAVIVKENLPGNKLVVAFIVPTEEQVIEEPELREYLAAKMHAQAIPSHIFVLPQMPLTATGKVDRVALSRKETGRTAKHHDAPKGRTQEIIAAVWKTVLNATDIGTKDNFFELGGHSINITLTAMRINEKLHVQLRADDIMRHPTIEQLAQMLDERVGDYPSTLTATTNELQQNFLKLNEPVAGNSNLIMLHPFAGMSNGYLLFAKSLQGKVNVYGISAKGMFDERVALPGSLEEVAHDYIQLFKEQGIRDNLYICGYSASVPLAFEITKQLEYQKIQVKNLFLVDDYFKAATVQLSDDRLHAMEVSELTWGLRTYFKIDLDTVPWSKNWLEKELNKIGDDDSVISGFTLREIKRCKDVIINLFHCQQRYTPIGKVNADIVYFYTGHYGDDHHWQPYTKGRFKSVQVEGMHSTIFLEENVLYNSGVFLSHILPLPISTSL